MDVVLAVIAALGLILLGLAAERWGADSRPTFLDGRLPETSTGLF